MSSMPRVRRGSDRESDWGRPVMIGIVVGIVLTAVVLGTASALGVPEKWFGSLFLLCSSVGSLTGVHLYFRESDRSSD